jgi:uncharacterized membrane-anchored protein YitT (DUF2179 family)
MEKSKKIKILLIVSNIILFIFTIIFFFWLWILISFYGTITGALLSIMDIVSNIINVFFWLAFILNIIFLIFSWKAFKKANYKKSLILAFIPYFIYIALIIYITYNPWSPIMLVRTISDYIVHIFDIKIEH